MEASGSTAVTTPPPRAGRARAERRRTLPAQCLALIREDAFILAVLALWAFAPLLVAVGHVLAHGGTLTGVNGTDYFDQFQYLAWIRDEGSHVLAANPWVIGPTPHDYLHPMYIVSGLLWRLGLSVQLAYLIWKPVAVLVLFLGVAAYMRRLFPQRPIQRRVALVVALFYATPVLALAQWTGHLSALHRLQLLLATDDGNVAVQLWGFEHTAIAIGLMPVFVLAAERALAGSTDRARYALIAGAAGLLVSWLHPWQGAMLILIAGAVVLLHPSWDRGRALVLPVAATAAPLLYGLVLSHTDASWRAFEQQSTLTGTAPWWALLASFGPLVVLAVIGTTRPRGDRETVLLLWLAAAAGVYFLVPQFPPHALAGVTVPLAVLAVRGGHRLAGFVHAPRVLALSAAVALVAVCIIPAAVSHSQSVADDFQPGVSGSLALQQLRLTDNQAAALAYLARAPRPGGVLAPWLLSMSVPGLTGRHVFAGHQQWQPHANIALDSAFYSPTLADRTGAVRRTILRRSGATFVIADCGPPAALGAALAPVAAPVKRFGCVTVYERYGRLP